MTVPLEPVRSTGPYPVRLGAVIVLSVPGRSTFYKNVGEWEGRGSNETTDGRDFKYP